MTLAPSASDAAPLDRATLLAAGGVLLLVTVLFAIIGALPGNYAFLEQVGALFVPLLCVPVFTQLRATFRAGKTYRPAEAAPQGGNFLSFALVAALLLTGLALFFDAVSIWQKALLFMTLEREGVTVDAATIDFEMTEGDEVVVMPLMFLAGAAIGWRMRADRVRWPLVSMVTIFVLMAVVRTLHLAAIGHFWIPTGEETDIWTWSDFWSDILLIPMSVLLGCVFGFVAAILLLFLGGLLTQMVPGLAHFLAAPPETAPEPTDEPS
jgi:hypothetical protein